MDKFTLQCPHCGQQGFPSAGALTQHRQRSLPCRAAMLASVGVDPGYTTAQEYPNGGSITRFKSDRGTPQIDLNNDNIDLNNDNIDNDNEDMDPNPAPQAQLRPVLEVQRPPQDDGDLLHYETAREDLFEHSDDEIDPDDDPEFEPIDANNDSMDANGDAVDANKNTTEDQEDDQEDEAARLEYLDSVYHLVQNDLDKYRERAKLFHPFTLKQKKAIQLMHLLRMKNVTSLETYEEVFAWHLRSIGLLGEGQSVTQSPHFISRERLFKFLRTRYNMESGYNLVRKIVLPFSKTRATIIINECHKVLGDLLTDPRIKDEDYLFWDPDDPFALPPPQLGYVADVNTGQCHLDTVHKLIDGPNQLLVGVLIYADLAETGQFANLPITAVKVSLTIFNQKARDKGHFWRTIGYIPKLLDAKSRGKRMLVDSGHTEGTLHYLQLVNDEGQIEDKSAVKAQDYHTMLSAILESFVDIQDAGLRFDFNYRDTVYKDVELKFYVPFIKCDTEEADKLCGKYLNRTAGVANLCRYCTCPTNESDDPLNKSSLKTTSKIQRLIEKKDLVALKAMSQHCIVNAMYDLRFGSHNDMGVHGACPMEMLHHLLLGIFKYCRDCFIEQLGGVDSKLAMEFDALAREFGELLSRQSDRNMPRKKFNNGILKGKLMAKEYTGVLLCILCALKSSKGRKIVENKKGFKDYRNHLDWILLLETLLQWEEWLKSDKMDKYHVQRAKKKHKYIMFLIKKIGNRTKGMGLKTTKFHGILHIAQDILNFGVPKVVDTGSNESHHKPTKSAAKLTQRRYETFDLQTAQRVSELHLLDLAEQEIEGRPLWEYLDGHHHDAQMDPPEEAPYLGGTVLLFDQDPESGNNRVKLGRKIKGNLTGMGVESDLIDFMVGLQDLVEDHIPEVPLYSMHKREGNIFRGCHSYLGKPWRDWVLIDWGVDGILPAKLWGFVDLTGLPAKSGLHYGGLGSIDPGLYAVVESSYYKWDEDDPNRDDSELFDSILLDVGMMTDGFVVKLKFFLADVEAIKAPATVVPNIGGPNNAYFVVANRQEWKDLYVKWLNKPHTQDVIDIPEPESEEEESQSEEE